MDILNFNSLDGGFIPICILSGISSVFCARIKNKYLGGWLNCISTIAIAVVWYQVIAYIWPVSSGKNERGWAWASIIMWSVFAIPASFFVYIAVRQSRRK